MTKLISIIAFTLLRTTLSFLPRSVTVCFLKYSRNVLSFRLNGILEEELYFPLLKGNRTVLNLPRLIIPVPVERKMSIRVGDQSQRLYWCGHVDEVASYVLRHLEETDSFIDIGTNCGFVTLVASSRTPGPRIYCFEPNPDTFRELTGNLRLNNVAANTFNLALSNKKERCRLFVPEGACGGSSINAKNYQRRDLLPGEELPTAFHDVEADSFDHLWKDISAKAPPGPGKIVVKLDAEGFELTIVAGMSAFLTAEAARLTLLIEVYESEYDAALKALTAHGFTCFSILGDGTTGPAVRPEKNRFSNYCFKMSGQTAAI
jgi:FkbM family methyltransferase